MVEHFACAKPLVLISTTGWVWVGRVLSFVAHFCDVGLFLLVTHPIPILSLVTPQDSDDVLWSFILTVQCLLWNHIF